MATNKLKGCFSHQSDDWKTPSYIYKWFIDSGYIDCFPFQCEYNQLDISYENKKLFINPPYSKMNEILSWLKKQIMYNYVALLVPARTDTNWFHDLIKFHPQIIFIKGRLHFNDSKDSAPFPSLLMIFNAKVEFNTYLSSELLRC